MIFGTPEHPAGWEKAPFPLVGIPMDMRKHASNEYTIVDHATPFSDWSEAGVGDVRMKVVDQTAIDGQTTKDVVEFEATFEAPDKSHSYRVVAEKALPHGKFFPTFGGVVTDHLLHGATGIGTRLMPTEYVFLAFWAKGKLYVDGKLVNDNHIVHVMVSEFVRKDHYQLGFESDVGGGGMFSKYEQVLHLMVPPYRVGPKGPEKSPLKTGYLPFPQVKKHMMQTKKRIMQLPPEKRQAKMARLKEAKALMKRTKEHVQHAMQEGKMFGQPFLHVMFGHMRYDVSK